jgi:hypothetical protein
VLGTRISEKEKWRRSSFLSFYWGVMPYKATAASQPLCRHALIIRGKKIKGLKDRKQGQGQRQKRLRDKKDNWWRPFPVFFLLGF